MKKTRQTVIVELIQNYLVSTQAELVDLLKANGIDATQATVSRDIKELKLSRWLNKDGKYYYSFGENASYSSDERHKKIFNAAFVSAELVKGSIALRTISGSEGIVAEVIKKSFGDRIIGVIPGNEIVLVLLRESSFAPEAIEKIKSILG